MLWITRKIEQKLEERLKNSFGEIDGGAWFSAYQLVRKNLVEQILLEIKAVEPNLTDHSAEHVADVLDKIERILGEDLNELTPLELYIVCLCALFHDVGNIHKREKHNRNISSVYDFARPNHQGCLNEKQIVSIVSGAHSGFASDRSKDTLKEVPAYMSLKGEKIRTRLLAAVTRFADELAEGPQRTSAYMQLMEKYEEPSRVYQGYASITEIFIDREAGRIALTYNIPVTIKEKQVIFEKDPTLSLHDLLKKTYERILKLDNERKYTKHYCDWLTPFKSTSAIFNFWFNGNYGNLDLPPIILTDLVSPDSQGQGLAETNPDYEIDHVISKLRSIMGGENP